MLNDQKRSKILFVLIVLFAILTMILFAFTMNEVRREVLTSINHPLDFVSGYSFILFKVNLLLFSWGWLIGATKYVLFAHDKSRWGMVGVAVFALPSALSVAVCWGWVICIWCADVVGDTLKGAIQDQLDVALIMLGMSFLGILLGTTFCAILKKCIPYIRHKLSTPLKKRRFQQVLQAMAMAFSVTTFGILLFTLDTCSQLSLRYEKTAYAWWSNPAALIHCGAVLIAGVELHYGIKYLLKRSLGRVPVGAMLLAGSCLKFTSIWVGIYKVLDTAYSVTYANTRVFSACSLSVALQCVVPLVLCIIVAQRNKRLGT